MRKAIFDEFYLFLMSKGETIMAEEDLAELSEYISALDATEESELYQIFKQRWEAIMTPVKSLAEISFPTIELYAMPAATATLLDDAVVNIDEWLAEEVRSAFAIQEGAAFVSGDGINKPKGFLAYPTVANGSWTWGSIGYIATGAAGAFPATNPADKLIDLIYSVKSPYRANSRFVINRLTL